MSTYEIQNWSSSDLKRKGGRPRKYATDEERQRAKREQDRKRQEKKRNLKRRRIIEDSEDVQELTTALNSSGSEKSISKALIKSNTQHQSPLRRVITARKWVVNLPEVSLFSTSSLSQANRSIDVNQSFEILHSDTNDTDFEDPIVMSFHQETPPLLYTLAQPRAIMAKKAESITSIDDNFYEAVSSVSSDAYLSNSCVGLVSEKSSSYFEQQQGDAQLGHEQADHEQQDYNQRNNNQQDDIQQDHPQQDHQQHVYTSNLQGSLSSSKCSQALLENQLHRTSASNTLNYDVEVQFLVNQLLVGHSCSNSKHDELLSTRKADLDDMQENSESLEEKTDYCLVSLRKFSQNTIKCVASSANILCFDFDKSNTLVGSTFREYSPYLLSTDAPNFKKLSKETCEIIFEGIDRSSTSTSHLVLNTFTPQSHSRFSLHDMSFDIDSFIAIPKSLAVAKRGFQICCYAPRVMNISTNIHLECPIPTRNRQQTRLLPYHEVPHVYLGYLSGFPECRLYMFFPNLLLEERTSTFLQESEYQRLIDVILASITSCPDYTVSTTQHYPSSFMEAKLKAFARHTELGVKMSQSDSKIQVFHYHLPNEGLRSIWNKVLQALNQPGFADLGGPMLLLDAKNLKTIFRSPNPSQVVQKFLDTWQFAIDFHFLSESDIWIDFAKEVVPICHDQSNAYSSLWKTCCLHSIDSAFQCRRSDANSTRRTEFYPFALTKDHCNMTITLGKHHNLRKAGLMYSQFYSSFKELFDAGKLFPFQEKSLEGLCIDDKLRELWEKEKSHASGQWNKSKVLRGYCAAKQRVQASLQAAITSKKSFGVREEHRMRWDLFRLVGQELAKKFPLHLEVQINIQPCYIYKTSTVVEFIYANVMKFGYGFEYSLARDGGTLISNESSKMATMFLRLLKHSLGGSRLAADSSVWIDKSKDKRTQLRNIGIGVQETIDLTGYGFIKTGKIDWNNWCFQKPISPDILFNYNAFYQKVNRHYNKVDHFSEIHQTAIQLFQWLAKILANENHKFWTRLRKFDAVSAIWAWTASILTWNFQQQILEVLAKDKTLRPEFMDQTSWSPHSIRFSREGLNKILRTTIIFGSNTGRTAIDRLNHLWQFNDNSSREGWDKKQYRLLYQALVGYWDQYMLNFGWQWNHHEFIKFFGRFCWVWPNTTNSKWWTKALHSNTRIWQGYASTALWFSTTQAWSLTGPEGEARVGKPDKLDSNLVFGDFESIVGRISASAGLVDCPGHLFIYQFRWKWGDSLWRKEQAPQLVSQLDGTHILESEIYRSPSEEILYQQKINDQDFTKKIFFDAQRTWYKTKGYTHVQEQIGERIKRTKEFIKESKLAMALSKEIPEFEQQWLRF